MKFARGLSQAVEAALAGEVVSSGIIGVNFTAGLFPLGTGGTEGAVWNNVGGHSGTEVPLVDGSGRATPARLTFGAAGQYAEFGAPSTLNRATNELYRGGLFGNDTMSEVRVSVVGIPYRRYDVFVFASADTRDRSALSITDGRTTFHYRSAGRSNAGATHLLRTVSTDASAPTVGPAQYQVFRGRTGGTLSLTTGGSRHCVLSNNVFGFQIVRSDTEGD